MTSTITSTTATVRPAGLAAVAGATIGVCAEIVLAVTPPAVGPDRLSHPLNPAGYRVLEAGFTVNRVLFLVAVLGLVRAGVTGRGRAARAGTVLTVAGLTVLALCEIGAFQLADSAYPTADTDRLELGYAVATLLVGVGLTATGIGVRRVRRWAGWANNVVLACGLAVFVVVVPGVAGPPALGHAALVTWMLLWAALGLALLRHGRAGGRRSARPAAPPPAALDA